jgi:redox-sensitive bicupin YhaK (pirin superfamily)
MASGVGLGKAATLHADATIYRAALSIGKAIEHSTGEERKTFIYVEDGILGVNGRTLASGDQARAEGLAALSLWAEEKTSFVLIDLPS